MSIKIRDLTAELKKSEERFQVANLEYEAKERRFIILTGLKSKKLDQIYFTSDLIFRDVKGGSLLEAIDDADLAKLVTELRINITTIQNATETCYERLELIKNHWSTMSENLIQRIHHFEKRGLKLVSNNLRLKLLPAIQELKQSLKSELVKGSKSRQDVEDQFLMMVQQARDDIFGDLTEEQIEFYEDLKEEMPVSSQLDLLKDKQSLSFLLELIETGKLEIRFRKKISLIQ